MKNTRMPGPSLLALSVLLRDEVSGRAYAGLTPLANFPIGLVERYRVLSMLVLDFLTSKDLE